MMNIDYTNTTIYNFYDNTLSVDNRIKTVGVCNEDKIDSFLKCNCRTDIWVQFNIPETIDIPTVKPNVEGIVSVYSCVDIINSKVIKTPKVTDYNYCSKGYEITNWGGTILTGRKIVVRGLLKQKIVYTALESEQKVHSASYSIPFSVYMNVANDTNINQRFNIYSCIEDVFVSRLSERTLFKNTTILLKALPC